MKVVYCRGGVFRAVKLCAISGMAYGVRHDYKPYTAPYMLDIRWGNYRWPDYIRKCKAYRPAIVMLPDFERPSQWAALELMLGEVKGLGLRPMICPKFKGAAIDLPPDVLIAVSVPTNYAGYLPEAVEVAGRDLHLLGGHPDQQAYLMRRFYTAARVESADGNVLARKAAYGQYWSARRGTWIQTPRQRYRTASLELMSAKQIMLYLHDPNPVIETRRPRLRRLLTP